jgi:hypothetical protein
MINLGMGVMINMLGGNESTVNAHLAAKGKVIKALSLDEEDDGHLNLDFEDGTGIRIYDDGRSCCEARFMTTDDDLPSFVGAAFTGCRVQDGGTTKEDYETKEVQFLLVDTSKGTFTVTTHNEHNGYYGGFYLKIDAK